MNSESVSPYTTFAPHFLLLLMMRIAYKTTVRHRRWTLELWYLFEGFSTALNDTICDLDGRHTSGVCCARVAVCDVGNVLQSQLTCVENTPESLCEVRR